MHLLAPFAISWWSPSTSYHCHCYKRSWDLWKCTFAFDLFVTFTNPLCMSEINLSKRYSIWKALALSFLCIFRLLSSLTMYCLTFSDLLQTYLRLSSILLDLPQFERIVLCLLNFERSNFMISCFKKQKK